MNKNDITLSLILSIVLTLCCPLFGALPLYYSVRCMVISEDDIENRYCYLRKAYRWLKICGITFVVSYATILIVFGFILYKDSL